MENATLFVVEAGVWIEYATLFGRSRSLNGVCHTFVVEAGV